MLFCYVQVRDIENLQDVAYKRFFHLSGELYKIEIEVEVLDGGGSNGVDFGIVRVSDSHKKAIQVHNHGKYPVEYIASLQNTTFKDVFTVSPPHGAIHAHQKELLEVSSARVSTKIRILNFPAL